MDKDKVKFILAVFVALAALTYYLLGANLFWVQAQKEKKDGLSKLP